MFFARFLMKVFQREKRIQRLTEGKVFQQKKLFWELLIVEGVSTKETFGGYLKLREFQRKKRVWRLPEGEVISTKEMSSKITRRWKCFNERNMSRDYPKVKVFQRKKLVWRPFKDEGLSTKETFMGYLKLKEFHREKRIQRLPKGGRGYIERNVFKDYPKVRS